MLATPASTQAAPGGLTTPFDRWATFHFPFDNAQDAGRPPLAGADVAEVPAELTIRGRTAMAVEFRQHGPRLDLYPLTVPRGYVFRRNLVVLFATLDREADETLRLTAGADWHMAWWCNGEACLSTFDDAGNGTIPATPLDHDVDLPLRRGRNVVAVAVLSGGRGFELHCADRPADVAAIRAQRQAAEAEHARVMRDRLRGEASVTVDCGAALGLWPRPERYPSISLNMIEPGMLERFTAEVGRPAVCRSFGVMPSVHLRDGRGRPLPDDPSDSTRRALSAACDEIMFPLPIFGALAFAHGELDEGEYERRIAAGLADVRAAAPNARWVEAFNESECGDHYVSDVDLYRCYRALYRAAARVEADAPGPGPFKLGGPSPCSFNPDRIRAFLAAYAADDDPLKRLDFVAYHQYLFRNEHRPVAQTAGERDAVRRWLGELGLPRDLPIFITEMGAFPGNKGSERFADDFNTQAAGVLTLQKQYLDQGGASGGVYPFAWTWTHANPRKNAFVPTTHDLDTRDDGASGPGDAIRAAIRPACDDRATRLTPFGMVQRLLAMLPDTRLAVDAAPANDEGLGLHAIAAGDERALAALLWNYQFTRYDDAEAYRPRVTLAGLPEAWRGVAARARVFRVDGEHSHFLRGGDDLACVRDERVELGEHAWSADVELPVSGVALVRLDRV